MDGFDKRIPIYPIRTVARLTGVNPRTLRGWERQNGLLNPARTDGGHRLFSEEDIDRVRWIKGMVDQGISLKGTNHAGHSERSRPICPATCRGGPHSSLDDLRRL